MIRFEIEAKDAADLQKQLADLFAKQMVAVDQDDRIAEVKPVVEKKEEPAPVVPMKQAEENVAAAPEHKEPEQPSIEEVRAALKELRDRKGSAAVKEVLKAYGADSLTSLKPEDYLGAMARAFTEV